MNAEAAEAVTFIPEDPDQLATVVGFLGFGLGIGGATAFGKLTEGGELAVYTPVALQELAGVNATTAAYACGTQTGGGGGC